MAGKTSILGTGRTGGREATGGVIPGRYALSVGMPDITPPDGWKWTPLSYLAQLESGHTPSRNHPEYWNGNIPWIGIKDATENHGRTIHDTYQHVTELGLQNSSARLLPVDTVCLSRTASVGFVVLMGRPMATSQDFVNWVCGQEILAHYLKYILLAETEALWRFASGTTHQTIYFPEAKAFHVCIPPLREQCAIVEVLGALDDKIELNRRISRTLERMIRAIFRAWFVDFEPVKAKAAGARSFPSMPEEYFDNLPSHLVESELGPVPQGWSIGNMGEIGQQRREQVAPEETPEDTAYIGLEHMPRRCIALTDWGTANTVTSAKLRFTTGDILFGKLRPYFHKVGPAPIDGVCSTDIVVLSAKKTDWAAWLLMLVSSDEFVSHANQTSAGTKMPRTNWRDMASFPVVLPPADLLGAYQKIAKPMLDLIQQNIHESRKLAASREYLLPKLICGEVRLPGAKRSIS